MGEAGHLEAKTRFFLIMLIVMIILLLTFIHDTGLRSINDGIME